MGYENQNRDGQGRWSETHRSEASGVSLATLEESPFDDSSLDEDTFADVRAMPSAEDWERYAAQASRAARAYSERYGTQRRSTSIDSEDIAQQALMQMHQAMSNGRSVKNPDAYINLVTSQLAASAGSAVGAADRKAYTIYTRQVALMEQELERGLSQAEREAIQNDIFENQDSSRSHRTVSRDFVQRITTEGQRVSLDAPAFEDGYNYGDRALVDHSTPETVFEEDDEVDYTPEQWVVMRASMSDADKARARENGETIIDRRYLRSYRFVALAQQAHLPCPAFSSLPAKDVAAVKEAVTGAGGVTKVVAAIADGRETTATAAFLSVFGNPDGQGARNLALTFSAMKPVVAQEMWDSATFYGQRKSKDQLASLERVVEQANPQNPVGRR